MQSRRSIAACGVAIALLLAACGGNGDDDTGTAGDDGSSAVIITTTTTTTTATNSSTTPTTPGGPTTTAPATDTSDSTSPATTPSAPSEPTSSPAPTSTAVPSPEPVVGEPVVDVELVTTVDRPVDLAVRPDDGALHLVNQSGTVVRFDPTSGTSTTTLDVSADISTGGERGLLGLVFSPDGELAYTNSTDPSGATTITEYRVAPDGVLDPTTARVVLTVPQPYSNHNAGDLAFGPDKMLYIPLGDGGSGGDPERRSGDPTSLLGSLLRIDPTPVDGSPYGIPADNPFATGDLGGRPGAPEVWAWGLRNPWKIAFDPANGDLWIADVGQNRYEEVNHVVAGDRPAGFGLDFGWSGYEGTEVFNDDDVRDGTTLPVLTYEHGADGCSTSGGVPYRGDAIDQLEPAYVYSDYCSGIVWALDLAGSRNLVIADGFSEVTAIRAGPDGELYVLEGGGDVSRLIQG